MGYDSKIDIDHYPGIRPKKVGSHIARRFITMSQGLRQHIITTHNNSLANLVHGVGERVLYVNSALQECIKPRKGIFERKLASYRELIAKGVGWQSPVARELFPSYYRGPRQRTYQQAVESLVTLPFNAKDAKLKTFVKAEKQNLTLKPNPVPRVIQPRSPRFNVELGRYLRPVEKLIYDEIDTLFNGPTIMSHYNAFEQAKHIKAKWEQFQEPACIGLDASRFDQHVSEEALRFEHKLYDLIFKSKELRGILELQIHNHGIAVASDGYFNYEVTGSRMSGDMNTSLGNKIIMCLMAKSYLDTLDFKVEFVNNGDDCLMFCERKNLRKLKELEKYFVEFGFNIVREEPVFEMEKIVFCQTSPICCNGIWRMVRNVKTCLTKDITSINLGHNIELYRELLMSIGDCGLATCEDVPVMGSFYKMLKRFGVTTKHDTSDRGYSYYYRSSQNAYCKYKTIDDEGRLSFYNSTGIIPDVQVELEKYFDDSVWGHHNHRQVFIHIDELLQ